MANKLKLLCAFVLSGCTSAETGTTPIRDFTPERCDFSVDSQPDCQRSIDSAPLEFELQTKKLYEDELVLVAIAVRSLSGAQILPITTDTTMLGGDRGFIDFPDINFDSVPDLAISTSFGTPNLYLDYWVYEGESAGYRYIGNMPELEIDPAGQMLRAHVRKNAATYESKTWIWERNGLIEQQSDRQP